MTALSIQNKINKGMGITAAKCGSPYGAFRPRGIENPLSEKNRYMLLPACFSIDRGFTRAPNYGNALWQGDFDASYTQQGDYLLGAVGVFFVASQICGLNLQCVLTNRQITVIRKLPAAQGAYSGLYASQGQPILINWPCSILEASSHAASAGAHETRFGTWTILLPVLPGGLKTADIVTDDLGITYSIGSAEQTFLGWRAIARQIGA